MTRYVRIFTTAPIDYDYGWTRGSSVVGTFDQGAKGLAEVRQVFVEESRAEMQRARYASGIYPSWIRCRRLGRSGILISSWRSVYDF